MFLTPKDLRVGNYVNYENTTHVIDEVHKEKVIHHWVSSGVDGYVTTYKQLLSIPLSLKEIEHLGFIEDFDRIKYVEGYFDNMGYFLEDDGGSFWLCRHNDEDDYVRLSSVEFIHELQNLYFDLTKRDLTYS